MGIYLNPDNELFMEALRSEIYIDKTGLIAYANRVLGTRQKSICVSRPRRFGKSMAAQMLTAYYSRGCDSKEMFEGLEISQMPSFEEHLNQYNVLFLNMQDFLIRAGGLKEVISYLQDSVIRELCEAGLYENKDENSLPNALEQIYKNTGIGFVIIIDEWDCIFREKKNASELQTAYLDFLRTLLKDKSYVKLAYMTGILPIKKYGMHFALNMFKEFSMVDSTGLTECTGFTEIEVKKLCQRYKMDFQEAKRWYDGYQFDGMHIYNPESVVDAMTRKKFGSYWTRTETYEALKIYIEMNYDGLKDDIILMLGGGQCKVETETFQNDMTTFSCKDDVMTLLIHLGYLSYDSQKCEVFIPNEEVRAEFARAMKRSGWNAVIQALDASEELLKATISEDADAVAKGIDKVHMDAVSLLAYNNENALSCVISLAYYSARNYYTLVREMPAGKGFADIVFLPRAAHPDKPAIVVELKWNLLAQGAISQIKDKQYSKALEHYSGDVLLVGVNYDKDSKEHQCKIERMPFGVS